MKNCTEGVACLLVMSAVLMAFGGCTHRKPDPNAAAFAAVSSGTGDDFRAALHNNTKLFQYGPQQVSVADTLLKKGTLVRMIRHQLGYSLVQTAQTSQLGWVANDDLGPAAPSDFQDQTASGNAPSEGIMAGQTSPLAPVVSKNKKGETAIVEQYKLDDPNHPESVTRRTPPLPDQASPQPTPQP